ncbi:rhodanese-like domain-containing protein [Mammaliicoccus vitulinus]|uniref:rhodanese-like domain-containing protein n=1 Tax=Mammaliicoccus vitulinus TaxID=71237 RepID=UPI00186650BF|nr:rhodanese-like domain-containing protein [Mammaliicoccus vitulinus]
MLNKVEFLETFLSLYINHHEVLKDIENGTSKYVFIEVRNASKSVKKDKIKNSVKIPAKDLKNHLSNLNKDKIYVLYDWTGGTMLGKAALLEFYKHEFESYELAGSLEDVG